MDALSFILCAPYFLNITAHTERTTKKFVPLQFVTFGRRGGVPQDVREKYDRMYPRTVTELDRVLAASGR